MQKDHLPTPQFQRHLQWQLETELRRAERFGDESTASSALVPPGKRRAPWLRRAALVFVSIILGAGGTLAAEIYQNSIRAQNLLEQTRLRLKLAEAKEAEARREFAHLEALVKEGLAERGSLIESRQRVVEESQDVHLLRLDLEEISHSGKRPSRDISAEQVAGRDFVTERLQQKLSTEERRLQSEQLTLQRAQQLFELGVVSNAAVRDAEGRVNRTEIELREIEAQLKLRQRFLEGELSAQAAERRMLRLEALYSLEQAQRQIERARVEVETTRLQHHNGNVSNAAVRQAEARLRELEVEMRLAELQLDLINSAESEEGNSKD